MADRGHELTDKMLADLEDRIADEYAIASRDMQRKFIEYQRQFEEGKKKQKALLDAGKITQKDYNDWVYRHTMMGKQWEQMRDVLAQDMQNANEIALKIARGEMPDVYALNANYGMYQIEHGASIDTGFTLYNHDTAELLMREQDLQLMPEPSTRKAAQIAADKSLQWNRQKIQSAVLQGVLQGESAYEVAARLRGVASMNYNASVRYARTMATNAQNAGRYQAFRRADDLGVDLTIEWQATLDNRTRHEHRLMHGKRCKVDEPFIVDGVSILWPAQTKYGTSDIPQRLIWNCRCTLLSYVKGFEEDTVTYSPKMGDMTFEEWQKEKADYEKTKPHEGSRQEREKRAKIKENTNAVMKPQEDPKVVSWVKPIVGEHSRKQDILAANPNYGKGYEWNNNCQRCVTAYEARRRGYDVTALSLPGGNDDLYYGYGFALPYNKGERKVAPLWYLKGYKFASPEMRSFTSEQALDTIENIMRGYGNGARAIIDGFWESSGNGHVFVCELVGGKVQFFDPQNGSMDCSGYIARMKPKALSLFRVDDLPFNDRIKDVFRNDI